MSLHQKLLEQNAMRIEPEEYTLFPVEKEIDGDSFRIRIALYPALIYMFLLGLTLVSFQFARLDTFLAIRFILFPTIYVLWGLFLITGFIATLSYFTTRISAYRQKITGRGFFLFARHFEIDKDQIKSVRIKQSALGVRMRFGTLIINKENGCVRIPWVDNPQNAKDALNAIYSLK